VRLDHVAQDTVPFWAGLRKSPFALTSVGRFCLTTLQPQHCGKIPGCSRNTVIRPRASALGGPRLLHPGTPGRTRTCNLLIRSQALYPLSYWGISGQLRISRRASLTVESYLKRTRCQARMSAGVPARRIDFDKGPTCNCLPRTNALRSLPPTQRPPPPRPCPPRTSQIRCGRRVVP
jgi:hypothetical protein